MGWWITLGILVLLAVLPLGVRIRYDARGALVCVLLGPVKITVFPRPKKDKKEQTKKKKTGLEKTGKQESAEQTAPAQPHNPSPPPAPKAVPQETKQGGSVLDFLPLVKEVFRFLDVFRRKLRLKNLEVKVTLASSDPCDLAVNYGKAWAALGGLMPQLERAFVIKKRDIEVACDFTASETLIVAGLDITITLGRLLGAAVVFAVRALIQYLKIMKKRKGGAEK